MLHLGRTQGVEAQKEGSRPWCERGGDDQGEMDENIDVSSELGVLSEIGCEKEHGAEAGVELGGRSCAPSCDAFQRRHLACTGTNSRAFTATLIIR
jgi:hypothetical protein